MFKRCKITTFYVYKQILRKKNLQKSERKSCLFQKFN